MGWRNYSRTFFKKIKVEHISGWNTSLKFYSLFLLYGKFWTIVNILKLSCRPLVFTSNKAFLENKKRSVTNLSA